MALTRPLPALNAGFTALCFFSPPVVGAAGSILFHIGAVWAFLLVAARRYPLAPTRDVVVLTAALWTLALTYIVSALVNGASPAQMASDVLWTGTLALFPFAYATWSISNKRTIALAAIAGSAAACYAALALAAIQAFGFGMRPEGGAGNPLVFATTVALAGLFALGGAFYLNERWRPVLWSAYLAALGAIGLSGARWAWIAVAIGTAAVVAVWWTQRPALSGRRALAGVAFGIVAVLVASKPAIERFAELPANWAAMVEKGNYGTELGERIAIWSIGLDLASTKPLLGHGLGVSQDILQQRLRTEYGLTRGFTHFHNGFLTLQVEAGVVAVLALAVALAWTGWIAVRSLRREPDPEQRFGATLLLALLAVYLMSGLTTLMVGHDVLDMAFMASLIVGVSLVSRRRGEQAFTLADVRDRADYHEQRRFEH